MPRIKLSDGATYRYKTIPLFPGVKQIDKEIALENLGLLKDVLDRRGIPFQITYGTLLGAIRENDFITHDEDIDLLIMDEDRLALFDTLPELKKLGFDVARYDRMGLMSIYRKDEYIDLYFFKNRGDGVRNCRGGIFPSELLEKTVVHNFKGLEVRIPAEYLRYLSYVYGDDWRIPVVWNDYELPKWKRVLLSIKSIIKELLPYQLCVLLSRPAEIRAARKYEKRLEKYRQNYCSMVDKESV